MSCPRNKHIFRCDQNGPPARQSEPDWQLEGAYLNRYVTDEQRSRRPIFIATPWARQVACFSALLAPRVSRRMACLFRGQDTGAAKPAPKSTTKRFHLRQKMADYGWREI